MHSIFPYSILTVLCSLLLCTSSKQYFGVEDTNTGYHFYDVDIQTNVLQGYIYRRGKVVRRMAPSEVETVQQELEYMMDRIYRELTGGKLQNCCKVIHVKNDSIGFFVEMVLPEGTNSSAAVEQLELHNAVLKMGLEIANSDHVELLIYGLVYNNEQVVPWSEEYKNVCGASYEQVTSELKKLIQSALGNGSNFSSTITEKLNKGRRYGYRYDSTSSPTTQTSIDFRRARLCPFQSMLAARVTIDVSDEVIKKLDRSEVYKEISEAIFAEGIRHITTDHFTFLRTGNRHTIVDC